MRRVRLGQRPRGPRAIDPASGFEVPYSDLVRQWDGEMVARQFVDKRNPQDLIQVPPERPYLPNARPEPPDVFMALDILMEDGITPIALEDGRAMVEEGYLVSPGDL